MSRKSQRVQKNLYQKSWSYEERTAKFWKKILSPICTWKKVGKPQSGYSLSSTRLAVAKKLCQLWPFPKHFPKCLGKSVCPHLVFCFMPYNISKSRPSLCSSLARNSAQSAPKVPASKRQNVSSLFRIGSFVSVICTRQQVTWLYEYVTVAYYEETCVTERFDLVDD